MAHEFSPADVTEAKTATDESPDGKAASGNETRKVVAIVLGLTALLALMLTAFALPAVHSGAHGIPVGVVAPAPAVQAMEEKLDGFEVTRFDSADAAREAILDHEVYGAFVVGNGHVDVLVASAASLTASQTIEKVGQGLAGAQHATSTVTDVRPFPSDDPRGAGLSAGALPLALGGWIGAVVIMQVISTTRNRLIAVFAFAVAGGLALTAVIQYGLGTFDGNYWLTSLAAMLGIAATAMGVLGLREFFGNPGLIIAAICLILLGNPLSGLASAPEMLPSGWGYLGQLLPPGATGSMLRSVALFDGHGALHGVIVLLCWLIGGIVLYLAGLRRQQKPAANPPAPAPA